MKSICSDLVDVIDFHYNMKTRKCQWKRKNRIGIFGRQTLAPGT